MTNPPRPRDGAAPLTAAAANVEQIAAGRLPEPITDEWRGDFNRLKQNLNTATASVKALVTDAAMLAGMAALASDVNASPVSVGPSLLVDTRLKDALDPPPPPAKPDPDALEPQPLEEVFEQVANESLLNENPLMSVALVDKTGAVLAKTGLAPELFDELMKLAPMTEALKAEDAPLISATLGGKLHAIKLSRPLTEEKGRRLVAIQVVERPLRHYLPGPVAQLSEYSPKARFFVRMLREPRLMAIDPNVSRSLESDGCGAGRVNLQQDHLAHRMLAFVEGEVGFGRGLLLEPHYQCLVALSFLRERVETSALNRMRPILHSPHHPSPIMPLQHGRICQCG